MSDLRRIGRWLAFPIVLGGALGAALSLEPELGAALAVLVSQGGAAIVIMTLERLLPFRPEWNHSHGDLLTDVCHVIVSVVTTAQFVRPLIVVAGVGAAGFLSREVGVTIWPVARHPIAQLGLALLIAELPQYWLHRWQHERDWLWRFHAVHHSAPRLYWLNAARFHPIDLGSLYIVGYVPLVLLGCPEKTIMLFALFDAVFGMLQHCNIDVRLGVLNRVFSMAEPHRWHHSLELSEANTNYGSNLIVWDLVFGTFFLPLQRTPPAATGIGAMPAFPPGYLAQLASPFRWRQVQIEAAAPQSARATAVEWRASQQVS